jgi:hypothetical protein
MHKSKYQTLFFQVTKRVAGSIASSLTLSTAVKIDKSNKGSIPKHMQFHRRKKRDCKKVKYKTSDSKHLTVIPAFLLQA